MLPQWIAVRADSPGRQPAGPAARVNSTPRPGAGAATMTRAKPALPAEGLRIAVEAATIDTVALAAVDMQGRLQGKRLHADYYLDTVLSHGTEACDYLLAVDVDMNTVGGYAT